MNNAIGDINNSRLNRINSKNINSVKKEVKSEKMALDDIKQENILFNDIDNKIKKESIVNIEQGINVKQEMKTDLPESHYYIKEENLNSSQNDTHYNQLSSDIINNNINNSDKNESSHNLDNDKKRKRDINDKSVDENLKLKVRKFDNNNFTPEGKNKIRIGSETSLSSKSKPIANVPIKYMKPIRHLPFRGIILWDLNNDTNNGIENSLTQRSRWNEGSWYLNENKNDISYEVQGESFQDFDRNHIKVVSEDTITNDLGYHNKKIKFCIRKRNCNLKKLLQKLKKINEENKNNALRDTLALSLLNDIRREHLEEELRSYPIDREPEKEIETEKDKGDKDKNKKEEDIMNTREEGEVKEEENNNNFEINKILEKEEETREKRYEVINVEDRILIELKYYILDNLITKKRIHRKLHENKTFVFRDSFSIPLTSEHSSTLQPHNQINLRIEGE
eukprot:jgi/Orpsp1_1/1192884/evm.model.d7180000096656.1